MALLINSTWCAAKYKTGVTASFYAEDFHGKITSNGEIYNMWAMTCAHKMLPFGTILRVTNLSNGKSVDVRVNDRGPFVKSREIDLSKGAAAKISMIGAGTAKVRLDIVKLGKYTKDSVVTAKKACKMAGLVYSEVKIESLEKAQDEKLKSAPREKGKHWDIQLGAFSSKENAVNFGKKVKKCGFTNVATQTVASENIVRVVLKDILTEEISSYESRLIEHGYETWTIRERKIQ